MGQRLQKIINNYWQKGTQDGTKTATKNEQLLAKGNTEWD